ncbi:uracil-DNA glycosylase family protein [Thiosocius teredinicola]|uniref:uracil-DNA glycosylase family protein n=1 Tax=Thiosocius teredinicola TaxID=1973002 RepID=UPI002FE4BEAB
MDSAKQQLSDHQAALRACRQCPQMIGPVVVGQPVMSPILMVGQAPGQHEGRLGRPFAWTAGKTLFGWYEQIGLDETAFRERVYMAAVCRCFPGKKAKGGDRVPSPGEIENCAAWLDAELRLLRPSLLIPVGKLAIAQFLPVGKLSDVIGRSHRVEVAGHAVDVIPLPHPSGASTWHRTEPGISLLHKALGLIESHPAWRAILDG